MGYNISDVGGETSGGVDVWTATLDLDLSSATTVSGDFDVVSLFNGANLGDATDGYVFSALSNPALGSLVFDTVTGTYTFTVDWSAVIATGSDQVISFTVTGTSGANSDTDTVQITLLICVTRGTLIDTPHGPVPVEDLAPGDLVRTLDHGDQQVRWIGCRAVTRPELQADPSLRPVTFRPGALDLQLSQPLQVSPQHRMLIQGWRAELLFGADQVLVPAKSLTDDRHVQRDHSCAPVEYFHLLFDQHEIIFTNGLPTESFHPGQYALDGMADDTRDELLRLFPELNGTGVGPTARMSLKPWEGAVLCPS